MTLSDSITTTSNRSWARNPGRLRAEPRPGAKFGTWERYNPLIDGKLAGGGEIAIPAQTIAYGLGWFSIALGLAETLMPYAMARLIGVRPRPALIWSCGVRELAAGIGILASHGKKRTPYVWSRVGGDGLDIALLVRSLASPYNARGRVALALVAVLGVTALDIVTARQLSKRR
jgi:hypothetical protein